MEEKEELLKYSKFEYEKAEERLRKLKRLLRAERYTSDDLEREMGVSKRTIKRDIAYLRKQGWDIRTKHVYYVRKKEEEEDGEEGVKINEDLL